MKNLKKIREASGYTQAQVARELNISRQTYNNYELGRRQADYETLLRLSEFFHTSVDNLLRGELPDAAENLLDDIKKDLPRTAKESERDRIVQSIVTKLQKLSDDDIDDMFTIFDYLDFRRSRPE